MTNLKRDDAIVAPNEVYLEAHGVPGTYGAPAAPIRRPFEPGLFDDAMWIADTSGDVDVQAGFRATVDVEHGDELVLQVQASSIFRVWVDGEVAVSGPMRYAPSVPEYHHQPVRLSSGRHEIAVHAWAEGLSYRSTAPVPGFVWLRILERGRALPLRWRARQLDEYLATGLRTSPLLGWVEWLEDAGRDWRTESVTSWGAPVVAAAALKVLGSPTATDSPLPTWSLIQPTEVARGSFRETAFPGYRMDDLAVQFLLADTTPMEDDDHDGSWVRYDLARIRLGSVELTVDADEPGVIVIAYGERLTPGGGLSPVAPLSTGPTRMMQRYAFAPGSTRIVPLQSLGGRWIEVRIFTRGRAEIRDVAFRERDALGEPTGWFRSTDSLLDQIWRTGIDTLRAAAEDAIVDSVRERGEWLGDVSSTTLHITEAGWSNTSLTRRALLHAAAGARPDGLVAGCGPGELIYLGTYAAQFTTACLDLATAEGDLAILRELEGPAESNLRALVGAIRNDGTHDLPWCFLDWGAAVPAGAPDPTTVAHVLLSVRAWLRWQELLRPDSPRDTWIAEADRLSRVLRSAMPHAVSRYHACTLGAIAGVIDRDEAVAAVIERVCTSFPFDRQGVRLRDPTHAAETTTTPYFTAYSFPLLLDQGLGETVREYWRSGWGWMLDRGATTWWEVFDDRWSQCHAWSGSPTWQLSRFVLGLQPRLTSSGLEYELRVNSLGLKSAAGRVPRPGGGHVDVAWSADGDSLRYELTVDAPITVLREGVPRQLSARGHVLVLTRSGTGDLYR